MPPGHASAGRRLARRLLFLLMALLAGTAPAKSPLFETSARLKAQDVVPLFTILDKDLALGLSAHQLARKTRITSPGIAWSTEFEVHFNGSAAKLRYRVNMQDNFAPDVVFASDSAELIDAIEQEIDRYIEQAGTWPTH